MFTSQQIKRHVRWATGRRLSSNTAWDALLEFKRLAEDDPALTSSLLGGVVPVAGHSANRLSGGSLKYFTGGAVDAMRIAVVIREHLGADEPLDVLDFGAGPGRLTRFFRIFWPHCRFQACDVDTEKVEFIKWATADVGAFRIPNLPPKKFDRQYDVIYAWSVWSHYNDKAALAWIKTLKEALKPKGLLIVTVHTEVWLESRLNNAVFIDTLKKLNIPSKRLLEDLSGAGYAFWPSYKLTPEAQAAKVDTDIFGMSIFTREYIKEHWAKVLDVVSFRVASPGWQDIVVMKNN